MSENMITVRSVKHYFNEFIAQPVQEHGVEYISKNRNMIRNQLTDAFRKEMFEQIIFKLGPEAATMSLDDLANQPNIGNILEQTFRKWRRLCVLCAEHGVSFISIDDLQDALSVEEIEKSNVREEVKSNTDEKV